MTSSPAKSRSAAVLVGIVVVLSLSPLLANLPAFRSLFYFQDEWDLIDQWNKQGAWPWMWTTFAENFVPLFKALWSGAIVAGGGSYFFLLALLWLNHALNTWLVVRLSRRLGAGLWGAAIAGTIFGVAWINFETLTWTVQWSAVLSLSFLLIGLDRIALWSSEASQPPAWRAGAILLACVLASALCFSRGVLTGGAFAVWALLAPVGTGRWRDRLLVAGLSLLPAAGVAWWIFGHSSGNHHHLAGALPRIIEFALYYYAQAPLRTLWSNDTPGFSAIVLLALAKSLLFAAGLCFAPRSARPALAALWAFELGNALLLGLGRYHTGLPASGSSRYQYGALASLLPSAGILLGQLLQRLPARLAVRPLVGALVMLACLWQFGRPWTPLLRDWTPGRGAGLRHDLFETPVESAPANFTGLPWMSNARAHELAAGYHLH